MGLFTRLFDHEYKELKKFESLADKIEIGRASCRERV